MATFSGCFRTERRSAMAETRATEKGRAQKSTKGAASNRKSSGFTAEERAAMKERARELKAEARMTKNRAAGESAVLAKIAEMPQQLEVLDVRLPGRGEPRRRRHVADLLRAEGVDRRRRKTDRRAGEESG